MSGKTDTFFPIRFGACEEGRAWIGRKTEVRACEDEVNWQAIKYFCALVRDGNPNYWNADEARRRHGAIISPPGMLMVWLMPLPWRPEGRVEDAMIATMAPLPGNTLINVSTDSEFFVPMKVGDRLTVQEEVLDVTPEKNTSLGRGHFLATLATVRNQNGAVVATNRNVMFRFTAAQNIRAKPAEASSAPKAQPARSPGGNRGRLFEDVHEGETLPQVAMPVTISLCVRDAAATHDFFPGHHDRDYAKAQNARDAYLNTMFFHGFVDRVVTDWAGSDAWIARRRLDMVAPVCVGDTMRAEASVVRRREDGQRGLVEVEVRVLAEWGLGARATITCGLPRAGASRPIGI